jgi:hypothetical protein
MTLFLNFFKNISKKLLLLLQFSLVFLYIIFEEIIWNIIAEPIYNFLESFRIVQKIDKLLRSTNRYTILILFVVLFVAVELLGIVAGGLLVSGKIIFGVGLYITKIPIAVFTFWMFKVVKSKLMTFDWFKVSFDMLDKIINTIKNSSMYKSTLEIFIKTKELLKYKLYYFKERFFSKKSKFIERIKRLYFFIKQRYKNN